MKSILFVARKTVFVEVINNIFADANLEEFVDRGILRQGVGKLGRGDRGKLGRDDGGYCDGIIGRYCDRVIGRNCDRVIGGNWDGW